jgi:cytochrome c peroxidase
MLKGSKIAVAVTCLGVAVAGCHAGGDDASSGQDSSSQPGSNPTDPAGAAPGGTTDNQAALDDELSAALSREGFTGKVGQSLTARLGRNLDPVLADLGRNLWFDKIGSLHSDNSCGGCHSPTNGLGDTQSIAIGIQNNNTVGPDRTGPRNQRRTPMAINVAFYPKLMWNGRFFATSGDPFDNSQGFTFPAPEGTTRFPASDPIITHLLIAHAHMPPTEVTEAAGFTGTAGTLGPDFDQFDDGKGSPVPAPDASGYRNEPIRQAVLARLNASSAYRTLFAQVFPQVGAGTPIDFTMWGRAIAEFEFSQTFADAPLDQFARGNVSAMTAAQKRGALVFFNDGQCVGCHAVAGKSNEMFSDFENHVAGVPQIAPRFGIGLGNVLFDGEEQNEDFGMEQVSESPADRYRFRTSPLRNLALQPAFFHNGAYTNLRDAVVFHLDAAGTARGYEPAAFGVAADLQLRNGPIDPVLSRIDPDLRNAVKLTSQQIDDLVEFLSSGLLDPRATCQQLHALVPASVPSGAPVMQFEACP